jgi:hypothetical protein
MRLDFETRPMKQYASQEAPNAFNELIPGISLKKPAITLAVEAAVVGDPSRRH